MNTKDQAKKYGVCDLEYAQELKRLGFKQESLWWWFPYYGGEPIKISSWDLGDKNGNQLGFAYSSDQSRDKISAYTVAELGEMLPYWIENDSIKLPSKSYKNVNGKGIEIEWFWNTKKASGYANTEANARAKMLIYLKKNGLLK